MNEAGTEVVVPGTYHTVDSSPVGPFETVKAIYNGMLNGGGVIFFVFIAYAAIGLIISTGAFNGLVAAHISLALLPVYLFGVLALMVVMHEKLVRELSHK